jgi:diadenosine tetraphosphate (Ap4A) HIT family hydrolase
MTLRSNKMTKRKTDYEASVPLDNCTICEKDGKRRGEWKIVRNLFPYDRIASKHDLLVPVRHVSEHRLLRQSEITQLQSIKASRSLSEKYSLVLENLGKQRSIKGHFHIHLIRLR